MKIKSVGITVKRGLKDPKNQIEKIIQKLRKRGLEVSICDRTCDIMPEKIGEKCHLLGEVKLDLLIVLGGDGTLLRVVHEVSNLNVPVLTINLGNLGFLTEFTLASFEKHFSEILNGKYEIDQRLLLQTNVYRKNKKIYSYRALNDAVIARDALARVVSLPTKINDEKLANYISDGLIVATPTGSTAYNLSAGGPILHPSIDAIILTPIAPHSLTQKPIVIPGNQEVSIDIKSNDKHRVHLTIDGQVGIELQKGDRVEIKKDRQKFKFVRIEKNVFLKNLQKKLSWGASNI
jgi:NAD+ kinase